MDFSWKYLYLVLGVAMFIGGFYGLFSGRMRRNQELHERELGRSEYFYLLELVVIVLGVILLRQAYIMFYGPGRAVVF